MARPNHSETIIAIYQAAMRPEFWAETLDLVADYLGVDSGMVLHLGWSRAGNFVVHRRLREDLNHLFLQRYTENPYALAFARAPIGKALVTDAVIGKEVLHRSGFYADILAPQGIAEIIAVRHADLSREGAGGILFNASKQRADDIGHAAVRLGQLVSHLSRAIDFTLLASRLDANQRQLDQLLAGMTGAAILLDHQGGILQMTSAAEALLGERDGVLVIKGNVLTLGAQRRDDAMRLVASIKQALAVTRGEPRSMDGILQIKRPSGRCSLLMQVMPLPVPSFSPWCAVDGGARVLVRIIDPQASIDAQAERLRLLVGLTAAETRVAALLSSGLGVTETAAALGVSRNTVKTHARQVFAKASVRSAAALARLVASIPAEPQRLKRA